MKYLLSIFGQYIIYSLQMHPISSLEFPQNYPPKINLLSFVIHNFQKMAKI